MLPHSRTAGHSPLALTSLRDIAERYDAYIIDLWGVIHDGSALYAGAAEALAFLHAKGKPAVFLSNAPRKAERAVQVLDHLGVPRAHYRAVVTSGQVACDRLQAELSAGTPSLGSRYYYLGPGKDEDVLDGSGYTQVNDPTDATFILNTGFEYDYQPSEEIEPLLQRLVTLRLPLLCVNPDMEVVKQDGTRLLCAGWVAARYGAQGGVVHSIGKPYAEVYDRCLSLLNAVPRNRLLAIGDNLATDVKGARGAGIDVLLITGGILASEHGGLPDDATLRQLYDEQGVMPDYTAPRFAL